MNRPPLTAGAAARAAAAGLVVGGGYRLALGADRHRRGIILGPLLMFLGWAETRESAGASSAFNLVNSPAGLAGRFAGFAALPAAVPLWAVAAVSSGLIGVYHPARASRSASRGVTRTG